MHSKEKTGMSETNESGKMASGPREYLTFRLDQEEYGIDILKVQEIRGYEKPTRIANAPEFIKGVVNLRGVIVPIIDLRLKLSCASAEYNQGWNEQGKRQLSGVVHRMIPVGLSLIHI